MQNRQNYLLTSILLCFCLIVLTGCGVGHTTSKVNTTQQMTDGIYSAYVTLEGGSGRATIESPAKTTVKNGKIYATIVWSSANYDYMLVNGEKYENEKAGNPEENSTFTIPVSEFGQKLSVIADTTAMSTSHEIEYTLTFELEEEKATGQGTEKQEEKATGLETAKQEDKRTGQKTETSGESVDFTSLTSIEHMKLSYATQFQIERYGEYPVITIVDDGRFLIVPEGKNVPTHIPEDMVVLQQPLNRTYLVSTSAMDLILQAGAISNLRLSGTKKENWYIEEAVNAMEKGNLLYAGKYNTPDYEMLIKENCNLAIENTMIYHNPETKEMLEKMGIPVLVEKSSYEEHPLGRLEWIKLYGVLFGEEEKADSYYEEQLQKIEPIMEKEKTNCSVAFFSVTSNGAVTVRKPKDYIAQMISLAGGRYVLDDKLPEADNALSTMKMQMESFYAAAKNADILIYNSTIEGEIGSIRDLVAKNALFADFKAVKTGKVYCTSRNFFQRSTGVAAFMEDLNQIMTGSEQDTLTYLEKLK